MGKASYCKLIYSDGSLQALKPLVAAAFAGCRLQCCSPSSEPEAWQRSLNGSPVFITSCGEILFSVSAAARYLLSQSVDGKESTVNADADVWLGWDSLVLAPAVQKADESVLSNAVEKLDATGVLPSPADYIIWSTLYPLLPGKDGQLGIFSKCPSLLNWLQKLSQNKICIKALKQLHTGESTEPTPSLIASSESSSLRGIAASEGTTPRVTACDDEVIRSYQRGLIEQDEASLVVENRPLCPDKTRRNLLVTSALPYVNNVPHLGNIIGSVLSADVFARYHRLLRRCVLYVCGTDEYGTATETRALQEGLSPQELCGKYFAIHSDVYRWFDIDFDHFGRTTNRHQTPISQRIFNDLHARGYTSQHSVDQLFCPHCDRFLADRFVEGECPLCGFCDARGDQCDGCGRLINAVELKQPRCKICSNAPSVRSSRHVFLELGQQQQRLAHWMDGSAGAWSDNARAIAETWLRDGLKARCITRDLHWGTPVPLAGFEQKVFYVWFDAPIGYISITADFTDQWKQWWLPADSKSRPEYVQFMAKDNVPFHAIVFPACLMATGQQYTLVDAIHATEYLNYEGGKFSKSRGVGVFGTDAINSGVPSDLWRFYLISTRPEGHDATFSWHEMAARCNSELLNNLGNFVNRALSFCSRTFSGVVPDMSVTRPADSEMIALVSAELASYTRAMEGAGLRDGLRSVLAISRLGNQYMQASEPWVLARGDEEERLRCATVISLAVNLCALLAVVLEPFMPQTAREIRSQMALGTDSVVQLGFSGTGSKTASVLAITTRFVRLLKSGHRIATPSPLFAKLESDHIDQLRKRFSGEEQVQKSGADQMQKPGADKVQKSGTGQVKKPGADQARSATTAGTTEAAGECGQEELPGDVESLEAAVAEQGDRVRGLKAAKPSDKAAVSAAVAHLLQLKEKLRIAQGLPPATKSDKGKKKKK